MQGLIGIAESRRLFGLRILLRFMDHWGEDVNRTDIGYRIGACMAVAALTITGLCLTYRMVLATWFVDSDLVDVVVLRDGVMQYGLRFLASWNYTADNWVFSVLPVYSLVYAMVGDSPAVLVTSGWIVFLLCAGLTAYLVWRLTGRAWVGAAIFALLLCPNHMVMGGAGSLGHPISHNTSLVWSLAAWVLIWRGLRTQRLGSMLGACGVGLLVALSDPWAIATLLLPAFLSSVVLVVCHPRERTFFVHVGALWLITAILARTRLLYALSFLPNYALRRPDIHTLGENLLWTLRSLGLVSGVLATRNLTGAFALCLGLGVMLSVLGLACVRLLVSWRALTGAQMWLFLSLVFSLAGTVGGAALGPTPASFSALHFLINFYFFLPVLVAISACWIPSTWFARVAFVYGILVAVTGVLDTWKVLQFLEQRDTSLVRVVKPLSDLLLREHLTYGYGPYWGAQANAVTWYSRGQVVIRPIRFDPVTGRVNGQHEQSSRLWVTPEDVPQNQSTFFIIFGDDWEICPDPARCEAGVVAQFGPPDRRLTTVGWRGDLTILVWSRRLYSPGTLDPGKLKNVKSFR